MYQQWLITIGYQKYQKIKNFVKMPKKLLGVVHLISKPK